MVAKPFESPSDISHTTKSGRCRAIDASPEARLACASWTRHIAQVSISVRSATRMMSWSSMMRIFFMCHRSVFLVGKSLKSNRSGQTLRFTQFCAVQFCAGFRSAPLCPAVRDDFYQAIAGNINSNFLMYLKSLSDHCAIKLKSHHVVLLSLTAMLSFRLRISKNLLRPRLGFQSNHNCTANDFQHKLKPKVVLATTSQITRQSLDKSPNKLPV